MHSNRLFVGFEHQRPLLQLQTRRLHQRDIEHHHGVSDIGLASPRYLVPPAGYEDEAANLWHFASGCFVRMAASLPTPPVFPAIGSSYRA